MSKVTNGWGDAIALRCARRLGLVTAAMLAAVTVAAPVCGDTETAVS
jgi:hypothetical protein